MISAPLTLRPALCPVYTVSSTTESSRNTITRSVMERRDAIGGFLTKKPYHPPSWASHLNPIPSHIYSLGHLPTPIHKWNLPNLPEGTEVWIKRDDLSGMQLSGNKVRKLEFLMADAVAQGADCVITVGGIQSNHCRATAVAARYLNLDCYLILRTSKVLVDRDPGFVGNLLIERLVGAHVELISKEEYVKIGSPVLADLLKKRLLDEGKKPYVIPVGGSNSLGTWGYIEAIREIEEQTQIDSDTIQFDDIVVACGSGGTIAGLSLGSSLSSLKAKVHAFSVCDDPGYFYDYVQGLLDGLQANVSSHDIVSIQDVKGLGYAMNTPRSSTFLGDLGLGFCSQGSSPRSALFYRNKRRQSLLCTISLILSSQEFMSDIDVQIPTTFDPFAEANAEDSGAGTKDYVHVRIQQRNGRKSLTTVQGLKKEFSYNKILKDLKKDFCCNGTVVQDSELGQVIQLQGDQRKNVSAFLIQAGIVKKENIKIHGF